MSNLIVFIRFLDQRDIVDSQIRDKVWTLALFAACWRFIASPTKVAAGNNANFFPRSTIPQKQIIKSSPINDETAIKISKSTLSKLEWRYGNIHTNANIFYDTLKEYRRYCVNICCCGVHVVERWCTTFVFTLLTKEDISPILLTQAQKESWPSFFFVPNFNERLGTKKVNATA